MNIKELDKQHFSSEDTEEYKEFIDKFKPKRTTDDCHTPPEVYEVVKEWVLKRAPHIANLRIARPCYIPLLTNNS